MKTTVIGLLSHSRKTRDQFINHMIVSYGAKVTSIDDAIKAEAAILYGAPAEALTDIEYQNKPLKVLGGCTPLEVMEATKLIRLKEDPHYWIRRVLSRMIERPGLWIVDQIQTPEEANFIHSKDGITVGTYGDIDKSIDADYTIEGGVDVSDAAKNIAVLAGL